ncbi:DUF3540 domain-containing protein [Caldimonas brevitalea]|uniref:DUF3540 domain-containing protein n=1 Tax=Caldimonas brevitalea TaxID=413882 RepID=A0A0G3BV62_9BURK|nr:DUF3540 domain-containing protein [Caldimonas brevitalea]AKJ31918.1 hypothetical protein AAW51_5227 [Caldimonas brevitalea]
MNQQTHVPVDRPDDEQATTGTGRQTGASSELTRGVIQQVGEVERPPEQAERSMTVSTPSGLCRARLATSCLTLPAVGDVVLLASHGTNVYVLAVLARSSAEPLVLSSDRDTTWAVQGHLAVRATGGVDLAGAEQLRLKAGHLRMEAQRVDIVTDRLGVFSRFAQWVAERLETTATSLRQVSQTHTMHTKGYHRQVDELESVRAGHIDLRAREMLHIHAQHSVIKSRELVKIDGTQIQVG